jgi:hypothetical protein
MNWKEKLLWRKNILFDKRLNFSYKIGRILLIKRFRFLINATIFKKPKSFYNIKKNRHIIKRKIKNQKILIIGSGPSATELQFIPNDIKIFTCKRGIKLLEEKKINKKIDLYFCSWKHIFLKVNSGESILDMISKANIDFFFTNKNFLKDNKYNYVFKDSPGDNYFLGKLIAPKTVKEISGNGLEWTSTGVRLLQYAIFFEAKEIYLIGIDPGEKGYFWDRKVNINSNHEKKDHKIIDLNFIKIMSKKNKNIYSCSKKSTLSQHIPYKSLF